MMNYRIERRSGRRSATASSTVELIAVIIAMVPIALLALNIAFIAFGSFFNDAAAREAARAASQQTSDDAARSAADNALKNYAVVGFGSPKITKFEFNFKNADPDPEAPLSQPSTPIEVAFLKPTDNPTLAKGSGNGTAGKAPNVVVVVQRIFSVPLPIFLGPTGASNSVRLQSAYVFPLVAGVEDPNDTGEDSGPPDEPPPEPDEPDPLPEPDPEP